MSLARLVFITVPNGPQAKKLAVKIVKSRLGACVNILPQIASIYQWEGKVSFDKESMLIVKTVKSKLKHLIPFVKENHPYKLPEIISVAVESGFPAYLNWIKSETK